MPWELRAKVEAIEILDANGGVMVQDVRGDLVLSDISSSHMAKFKWSAALYHIFVKTRGAEIGYTWHRPHLGHLALDRRKRSDLIWLVVLIVSLFS